jgi:6-phosphofructokinase
MSNPNKTRPYFFISYCVDDQRFVDDVCHHLEYFLGSDNMFLFKNKTRLEEDFLVTIDREAKRADCMIAFIGRRFDAYQWKEVGDWLSDPPSKSKRMCLVGIGGQHSVELFPELITKHAGGRHIIVDSFSASVPPDDVSCAREIHHALDDWMRADFAESWKPWSDDHLTYGLPKSPQLFDYEKKIIEFYAAKQYYDEKGSQRPAERGTGSEAVKDANARLLKHWPLASINEKLKEGAPGYWPNVHRYPARRKNPLDQEKAGDFRGRDADYEALVRAGALLELESLGKPFTFPEAGPRPDLAFPQAGRLQLNVGILVAGGIAPGINAVVDAIVQRHDAYLKAAGGAGYNLQVLGIKDGFLALDGDNAALGRHLHDLKPEDTVEHATRGGSMLGTSRDEKMLNQSTRLSRLEKIARALSQPDRTFDILYVIGGDGSMKASHALWRMVKKVRSESANPSVAGREMSVVAIPKTMDNDILWVWQSFGFLSAVDESRKIVETLHTEVRSNPRLGIVQLFGSDSGFVVSHAVLAAAVGHAMLALIPEVPFSAIGVARYLKEKLWAATNPNYPPVDAPIDAKFPHGLVVMAETAIPQDALECLGLDSDEERSAPGYPIQFKSSYDQIAERFRLKLSKQEAAEIKAFVKLRKEGRGFEGQTNDTVRQLGLRLLAEAIPVFIKNEHLLHDHRFRHDPPDWNFLRVVCSEPRHLVRALEPSTSDIITGQRLGILAVDAAMAGYTDCMISQWLTEFALVPLELVVLGRKRIPPQGMFWKSVTSKTDQAADLVHPYVTDKRSSGSFSAP